MKNLKVIISGGGTGGHIFPAISIANELKERVPGVDILFVGALGRMEMERVPAAGFPIEGLPVMGFPRKPSLRMITFFFKLYKSLKIARSIVHRFKPDVAIGVGGYASGPLLKAAVRKGIPAILQEQNSYAGVTNKLLAGKVRKICVAYPDMEKYFPAEKIVLTGNPIRKNLLEEKADKATAADFFGLDAAVPVVLVVGGSQGAGTLNQSILSNLSLIEQSGVQVIWQTGSYYYSGIQEKLKDHKPANLVVTEFVSRMDLAYALADVVVSRAGAGTISELCLLGKASVLVPSPNVAEDHQTKNAMSLVRNEAAIMIADREANEKLWPAVVALVSDQKALTGLKNNILKLAKPDAAKEIVDVILKELK